MVCGLRLSVWSQGGSHDYQYALIEAVKQKNLGNLPGAIELYKMVIEEDDSVAIAHYELGTLYLMVKQPELAEEALRKAYELDKTNEWYVNGYLDALVFGARYNEADEMISDILKSTDKEVEYLFKRANIYYLDSANRKALKLLDKIEKEHGISEKVILLKAQIYEKEEKFEAALAEIHKLIQHFPNPERYDLAAAELALKSGKDHLASKYYSEVLSRDSTDLYALTKMTDYYRKMGQHKKSFYYLKKTFKSEFIEYKLKMSIMGFYLTEEYFLNTYTNDLEELITILIESYPEKSDIKLYAVDFYIHKRDYKTALKLLKPLINESTRDYEMWRQAILLSNAVSDNGALLELSRAAEVVFPDSTEILYFKGIAEYENEMYGNVITTFNDERIQYHENYELRSQTTQILAESYHKLKKYYEADSLFRRIIQKEPNNYLVLNNFSYYLALRGESLVEAKELSYKTILENPENGTFLDTYAWILYKMGAYEEAEKYINKALQKGGMNDPDVNEHAAEIQLKLESYHIARSFFEKAIILGGDKDKLTDRIKYMDSLNEKE